jgi:type II secretory pathway pseudopilin PulG
MNNNKTIYKIIGLVVLAGIFALFGYITSWTLTVIFGAPIVAGTALSMYLQGKSNKIYRIGFLIIILWIAATLVIPNFMSMGVATPEKVAKANMHTLQLTIEDFYIRAGNKYPANLNVTIEEITVGRKENNNGTVSMAGAYGDTIYPTQIGAKGPSLLPINHFRNSFNKKSPVVICNRTDPPIWNKKTAGVVYYVPVGINGDIAAGYKIYGSGKEGLIPVVISSPQEEKPKGK